MKINNIEPTNIAIRIMNGCDLLGKEVKKLIPLSMKSTAAAAAYDKAVGIATFKLKDEGHPATLIPNMIKRECADEHREKLLAEALLKACYATIDSYKAKINALQSINRYLSDVPQK